MNNLLAFPGIFRGALDVRARKISEGMKLAAARAIADIVGDERNAEYIIPSVFDARVVDRVAEAVRRAAIEEGLARRTLLRRRRRRRVRRADGALGWNAY